MKIASNTFVELNYELEVDGQIADKSQPGSPLKFPYGMGMLLPKFEEAIVGLRKGDTFKFTLKPEDGYGEVIKEAVVEIPKDVFMVNGEIEQGLLEVGNQIPMADNHGGQLLGKVIAVGEAVTMDFNHPMAGATLNFSGSVADVREVKPEDLAQLTGGGCGCGCEEGDCEEGGCDGESEEGSCGCSN